MIHVNVSVMCLKTLGSCRILQMATGFVHLAVAEYVDKAHSNKIRCILPEDFLAVVSVSVNVSCLSALSLWVLVN